MFQINKVTALNVPRKLKRDESNKNLKNSKSKIKPTTKNTDSKKLTQKAFSHIDEKV